MVSLAKASRILGTALAPRKPVKAVAAYSAPVVSLDTNYKGQIQRIAPRYDQSLPYSMRTRFKIGATVDFSGKRYAAELHESNGHALDVILWQIHPTSGRRVREDHLLDVRQAVRDAYAAAFGLRVRIVLGVGTQYRRAPDLIQTGVTL